MKIWGVHEYKKNAARSWSGGIKSDSDSEPCNLQHDILGLNALISQSTSPTRVGRFRAFRELWGIVQLINSGETYEYETLRFQIHYFLCKTLNLKFRHLSEGCPPHPAQGMRKSWSRVPQWEFSAQPLGLFVYILIITALSGSEDPGLLGKRLDPAGRGRLSSMLSGFSPSLANFFLNFCPDWFVFSIFGPHKFRNQIFFRRCTTFVRTSIFSILSGFHPSILVNFDKLCPDRDLGSSLINRGPDERLLLGAW